MNEPLDPEGPVISIPGLLAPLVERWRSLVLCVGAVWVILAAVILIRGRGYDARMQVAAVTNSRTLPNLSGLGGAASLLGGALGGLQSSGLQVTPALVKSLILSQRVLYAVGTAESQPGQGRLVDRLAGPGVPPERVAKVMSRVVETDLNRETGIITLKVSLRDSALARLIVERVLSETRDAYVSIVRSQASQQRQGQQVRVDSAGSQLANAERALADFDARNRTLASYSQKTVERQALERRVQISQQVYLQAVTDRESAVARELEATPVLAVVDSLPAVLPPGQRLLFVKLVLAALAVMLVWGLLVLTGEGVRRRTGASADLDRFRRAVQQLPLVGRLVGRPASGELR